LGIETVTTAALRFHAPYMQWAKHRPSPRYDLAISNVLPCSIDEIEGARDAIALSGRNDTGYAPLMEAIAARYGVSTDRVTTAQGTSGANFLACAALVEAGDDVLVERPGYDPLLGAPRLLGARTIRFDRTFDDGFALDPDRVRRALTPGTRLIILTSPHNPTGVIAERQALEAVGRLAESQGAHVLVDEVYLDASDAELPPAVTLGDVFLSTSSLTKSYGLAGLRCGWILSSAAAAERLRRARDVVDGTGPIVTERLAALAFHQLERLIARSKTLLHANGALVREFLHGRPELAWVEPRGGTVVFPRLRDVADATDFAARLLAERETAIVPGKFFDAPPHFRIGFGGPTESLRGGLTALGEALDARAW
jgi:aspartate/methionine/tyrosine aminotransferase